MNDNTKERINSYTACLYSKSKGILTSFKTFNLYDSTTFASFFYSEIEKIWLMVIKNGSVLVDKERVCTSRILNNFTYIQFESMCIGFRNMRDEIGLSQRLVEQFLSSNISHISHTSLIDGYEPEIKNKGINIDILQECLEANVLFDKVGRDWRLNYIKYIEFLEGGNDPLLSPVIIEMEKNNIGKGLSRTFNINKIWDDILFSGMESDDSPVRPTNRFNMYNGVPLWPHSTKIPDELSNQRIMGGLDFNSNGSNLSCEIVNNSLNTNSGLIEQHTNSSYNGIVENNGAVENNRIVENNRVVADNRIVENRRVVENNNLNYNYSSSVLDFMTGDLNRPKSSETISNYKSKNMNDNISPESTYNESSYSEFDFKNIENSSKINDNNLIHIDEKLKFKTECLKFMSEINKKANNNLISGMRKISMRTRSKSTMGNLGSINNFDHIINGDENSKNTNINEKYFSASCNNYGNSDSSSIYAGISNDYNKSSSSIDSFKRENIINTNNVVDNYKFDNFLKNKMYVKKISNNIYDYDASKKEICRDMNSHTNNYKENYINKMPPPLTDMTKSDKSYIKNEENQEHANNIRENNNRKTGNGFNKNVCDVDADKNANRNVNRNANNDYIFDEVKRPQKRRSELIPVKRYKIPMTFTTGPAIHKLPIFNDNKSSEAWAIREYLVSNNLKSDGHKFYSRQRSSSITDNLHIKTIEEESGALIYYNKKKIDVRKNGYFTYYDI